MFLAQVIAAAVAGTTQLGVQAWMFTNIEGMWFLFTMNIIFFKLSKRNLWRSPTWRFCLSKHDGVWNRQYHMGYYLVYAAHNNLLMTMCNRCNRPQKNLLCRSNVQRLVGFSHARYHSSSLPGLLYFFLAGFLAPVLHYLATLKWPNSWVRYVKYVPRY